MANQIEIFNIDFGDTIQSINQLKSELKETKKLFELAKPNTAEFNKYSTEVKRLDGTIKALNGATKENVNALGGVNNAAKFAAGSYGELKQKIDQQKKSLLELNVESEDFANAQKELIILQEQRIAIEKKIPSLFQERIKLAVDESNSLKQLKQDLKAAQSAALNGDGAAAKKVAELKDKIDDLKDSTKSLQGSGIEKLNNNFSLLSQGFQDLDIEKIKTGFKGIGAAASAIPIFLLVEGIKLLIDNFEEIVKFGKELTGTFSVTEQNVQKLTVAVQKETIANKNLIASYSNEIALLEAKGGHEKEILALKKKKIEVEIAEAENTYRLNIAKVTEAVLNNSITDSLNGIYVATLRKIGATELADNIEKITLTRRKARILEEQKDNLKAAQDAKIAIEESKTALLVLDIEYNKKQYDNAKKLNDEKKKLLEQEQKDKEKIDKENADYQNKLYQDEFDAFTNQIKLEETEAINAYNEKKRLKEQDLQDNISKANTKILDLRLTNASLLEAELELLNAKKEQELNNTELSEAQKAEIKAKYREEEFQLNKQNDQRNLERALQLNDSLANLSNSLFDLQRSNLVKGTEEDKNAAVQQFEFNQAFAYANALVQGALAQVNASATIPYLPLGLLASINAGIATATSLAKIKSTKFQYFEGGYTQSGNPTEQAESIGNSQFHKGEYVVPNKVLTNPVAQTMVSQLEVMRKGFKSSNISGFFDGGYTSRSVSANAVNNNLNQQQIIDSIKSMPTPIVKVTDINSVNNSVNVAMNVSSL